MPFIYGTDNADTIDGTYDPPTSSANDTIKGGAGDDYIDGQGGDDYIQGGTGADTMIGGSGYDRVDYTQSTQGISVDVGYGFVSFQDINGGESIGDRFLDEFEAAGGSAYQDLIIAGQSGTDMFGQAGDDILYGCKGFAGNDSLDGGTGADTMIGGLGDDIYVVDNVGDYVRDYLSDEAGGLDIVYASITYTLPQDTDQGSIENLTLTGTDAINGTGNTVNNTIVGNGAANVLDGKTGADTMSGGEGSDTYIVDNIGDVVSEGVDAGTDSVRASINYTLTANVEKLTLTGGTAVTATGNTLANQLFGTNNSNILNGLSGADTMTGYGGDDRYYVDSSADVVVEAANGGTDTVRSSVTHTLAANVENLVLTGGAVQGAGNALANTINGTNGANTLIGLGGADTMTGFGGDDLYYVDSSGDRVIEAASGGVDRVKASVSHALAANVENLTLTGTAITGVGNGLKNAIVGTGGSNTLDGGLGNDTLTGGDGADRFTFTTALGTNNIDLITDFVAAGNVDTIRLENAVFVGLPTGALAGNAFVVSNKAQDAQDRIIYNQNTGALYFDRDGSGGTYKAMQFATLDDHLAMTAGDFLVI